VCRTSLAAPTVLPDFLQKHRIRVATRLAAALNPQHTVKQCFQSHRYRGSFSLLAVAVVGQCLLPETMNTNSYRYSIARRTARAPNRRSEEVKKLATILLLTTSTSVGATASTTELPQYEVLGFPITPHQSVSYSLPRTFGNRHRPPRPKNHTRLSWSCSAMGEFTLYNFM
jgi:hypothetical protein